MALLTSASPVAAQGYRLRLDLRSQSVRFRGWQADSLAATGVVPGPSGGLQTSDGFAVRCPSGDPFCFYFRPGETRHAAPFGATATGTMWGLGLAGLSVHGSVRLATDFTGDSFMPGTEPAAQLLELYADYTRRWLTGRVGRVLESNRLGVAGYDGVRLAVRSTNTGLEAVGYGGLGLGRSSLLPITSPELNPFDQFQLSRRQWLVGGGLGWSSRHADIRLDYRREVDRSIDKFVSERASASTVIRPLGSISLRGSVEYDIALHRVGRADATINWNSRIVAAAIGYRHYRPTFQLWEIWAAFNTIPYDAATGEVWLGPWKGLRFSARGEVYRYDDNTAPSPLVTVEDDGWRSRLGVSYVRGRLNAALGYAADFGPGAASHGWDARVGYDPTDRWTLTVDGGRFERPLEYRFDDSRVHFVGLAASYRLPDNTRFRVRADYFDESRRRPDAAAFSWDQTRLSAEVTLFLSSRERVGRLPPGRMPRRYP